MESAELQTAVAPVEASPVPETISLFSGVTRQGVARALYAFAGIGLSVALAVIAVQLYEDLHPSGPFASIPDASATTQLYVAAGVQTLIAVAGAFSTYLLAKAVG